MFCPSCGTQTEAGIKYCKQCGLALNRIRGVMSRGGANTNWNDVWMQDHQEERERKRKKSPEEKRYEEIKAGVITTSIGISATLFLGIMMNAIAMNEPHDAAILRTIWLAGLVPTFIGLALLFNGLYVSRKIVELKRREALEANGAEEMWTPTMTPNTLNTLDTASINALPAAQFDYSVTEHTTAKLKEKAAIPASRDTH